MNFEVNLARGILAEGRIAQWLRARGWTLMPAYEKEIGSGKGPQIYAPMERFVSPDFIGKKGAQVRFIEAKSKSVFSWYRKRQRWETGIDLRHYREYQKVRVHFGWCVWILFLHEMGIPDARDVDYGCPPECPTGLFGQDIDNLAITESHTSDLHGRSGMVYWAEDSLRLLATLDSFNAETTERTPT